MDLIRCRMQASIIDFGDTSGVAVQHIDWPELRFPPINLWVMATLPCQVKDATHNHRKQRPVFSTGKNGGKRTALHHLMSQQRASQPDRCTQIQRLLAMR